jgi:L-cystine uptake protein TcyP (sodium:dicarboxylate symporter family)
VSIGASIFLIALGAILYFAIDLGSIGPVEISTVGVILMIAGVVGLIISLFFLTRATTRGRGERDVVREREIR